MSVFKWLVKSKKEMSEVNTRPVRIGKYTITSHAQNRVAQKDRKVSKLDMLRNLFGKPNKITEVEYDKVNRPAYNRIGKVHTSAINPVNNNVASIRKISNSEKKKYNLKKKGKKYYVHNK